MVVHGDDRDVVGRINLRLSPEPEHLGERCAVKRQCLLACLVGDLFRRDQELQGSFVTGEQHGERFGEDVGRRDGAVFGARVDSEHRRCVRDISRD